MSRNRTGALITLCSLALTFTSPMTATAQDAASPESADLDPASFSPMVTNPFVPLASLRVRVYEGEFPGEESGETYVKRVEERILPETVTIAGIEATVIEITEYVDGELTEVSHDYFAQGEDGTVYYLGEDVEEYADGEVVSDDGAWRVGEGENQPGIFMPPTLDVDQEFEQEQAPGVAEERSVVIALDEAVTVPAGSFAGCLRTEDFEVMEGDSEFNTYCPGVGLVREENEEGSLDLIYFEGGVDTSA